MEILSFQASGNKELHDGVATFNDKGGIVVIENEPISFNTTTNVEDKHNFICALLQRIFPDYYDYIVDTETKEQYDIIKPTGISLTTVYKIDTMWTHFEQINIGDEVIPTKNIASDIRQVPQKYCKDENINKFLSENLIDYSFVEAGIVGKIKKLSKKYNSIQDYIKDKDIKAMKFSIAKYTDKSEVFIKCYYKYIPQTMNNTKTTCFVVI